MASWRDIGLPRGKPRGHGTTGLTGRLREEDADAAWVLTVFDTKLDANIALEATVAAKFGLPQMCFMARGQLVDQGRLDSFWAGFGDLSEGAHACLRAFGREPEYPIARRTLSNGTRDNYLLYTRASTIRACNLVDGMEFLDARALLQVPTSARRATDRRGLRPPSGVSITGGPSTRLRLSPTTRTLRTTSSRTTATPPSSNSRKSLLGRAET